MPTYLGTFSSNNYTNCLATHVQLYENSKSAINWFSRKKNADFARTKSSLKINSIRPFLFGMRLRCHRLLVCLVPRPLPVFRCCTRATSKNWEWPGDEARLLGLYPRKFGMPTPNFLGNLESPTHARPRIAGTKQCLARKHFPPFPTNQPKLYP